MPAQSPGLAVNALALAALMARCTLGPPYQSTLCRAACTMRCEDHQTNSRVAVRADGPPLELPPTSPLPAATANNPYAPKLTVDQRREAVRRCAGGEPQRAVARHFGVGRRSIENLVQSGRYGGQPKAAVPAPTPGSPPPERVVTIPSGQGARKGVDVLVYGLPVATHRSLEALATEVGWSVAAFAREMLVCCVLPSPPPRAMPIRRVGLRHLVSTWEATG